MLPGYPFQIRVAALNRIPFLHSDGPVISREISGEPKKDDNLHCIDRMFVASFSSHFAIQLIHEFVVKVLPFRLIIF